MKLFYLNFYTIIFISFVVILCSLTEINAQKTGNNEDIKQLFSKALNIFNKTEIRYQEISEKMKNIKYNIFLKIRYKNLKRKYTKINIMIANIRGKIDINDYDSNVINEDLYNLDIEIQNFGKKCEKAIVVYNKAEHTKKVFINIIKVFFITLILIIVIVMIIIAVVSIIIIRRQRKYHALEEEISNSNIEINVGNNYNRSFDEIKETKENENLDQFKKMNNIKKKKGGHQSQKSEDIEIN